MTTVEVTEEQVLFFRARRGHLAGTGAPNAIAAARAIVGAQSQQLPPSLLALSMRTRGRPTAEKVKTQLLKTPPKLVRTWGQRDTLHVYDPHDWASVISARDHWTPGPRGGPMPTTPMLDKALAAIRSAREPVTRSDLIPVAPPSYVSAVRERARAAGMDADRLAAGRLLWRLAHRGDLCVADKIGSEQAYALRSAWFPGLEWPDKPLAPLDAASSLARRYLGTYGPATAADVAHFFGARVTRAREWLAALDGQLTPVGCGDRKGLLALTTDVGDLKVKPPSAATGWPLRLLPLWESTLMGHKDKSWTVPDDAERTLVWRKGAFVAAVALARGRVVATWSQAARRGRLVVEVQPLSRWSKSKHAAPLNREASAIAARLGLDGVDVSIGR